MRSAVPAPTGRWSVFVSPLEHAGDLPPGPGAAAEDPRLMEWLSAIRYRRNPARVGERLTALKKTRPQFHTPGAVRAAPG